MPGYKHRVCPARLSREARLRSNIFLIHASAILHGVLLSDWKLLAVNIASVLSDKKRPYRCITIRAKYFRGTTFIYRQLTLPVSISCVHSFNTITYVSTSHPTCICSICFQCAAPGCIHNPFFHAPLISRLLSVRVYGILLFPF